MAKTNKDETLKEFECPNCGTIHIINSSLDIKHSFYEEDPKQAEKVAKAKGAGDEEEEDRGTSSGEEESETFKEEEQEEEEKDETPEDEDEDEDPFNWGGWK